MGEPHDTTHILVNLFPCGTVSVSKAADYAQFQFQAGARDVAGGSSRIPRGFSKQERSHRDLQLEGNTPCQISF